MRQPGRAYALFRARIQGPEMTRRLREFGSRMPELELKLRTPSQLDDDIQLALIANAAKEGGSNISVIATDKGSSNAVTAGQLKAVLRLVSDLIDGSFQIFYKVRDRYESA